MISREKDSYKGENGKVLVIGGSKEYAGAPALSAQAALRSGADLVQVFTSETVRDIVAGYSENLIVEGYEGDYLEMSAIDRALELAEWADVAVIGPGLGNAQPKAVRHFIQEAEATPVIDADALKHVGRAPVENSVLTPHRGEFEELEDFLDQLLQKDNIVLRKGSTDRIYSREDITEIDIGHPGMTVGGTGDVLTGIVAGLISQGMNLGEAAVKAARINGEAGEEAAEKYRNGLVATDLLDHIPSTMQD